MLANQSTGNIGSRMGSRVGSSTQHSRHAMTRIKSSRTDLHAIESAVVSWLFWFSVVVWLRLGRYHLFGREISLFLYWVQFGCPFYKTYETSYPHKVFLKKFCVFFTSDIACLHLLRCIIHCWLLMHTFMRYIAVVIWSCFELYKRLWIFWIFHFLWFNFITSYLERLFYREERS